MKTQCPQCRTPLALAKVPATGATLRCPRCSHAFPFEPPAEPTPETVPTIVTDPLPDFSTLNTQTTATRRRSRKKRNSSPGWLTPVMIVTGLIGLTAAIWTVVLLASSGEKPPDTVAIDDKPAPKKHVPSEFIQQLKAAAPDPPAGGGSGPLDAKVLDRVRSATVLLRVTDALGRKEPEPVSSPSIGRLSSRMPTSSACSPPVSRSRRVLKSFSTAASRTSAR